MKKMEGPWYTLDDAQEKLGINRSEFTHLVSEGQIQPVVYTRPRRFLLFRRSDKGWTGVATCDYRGHLILHHSCITQLMDGEELTVGTGSGILCEEQGVSSWASAYPFEKPLPHEPLIDWNSMKQEATGISKYAATPFPEEYEHVVSHLTRTILEISKKSKIDQSLIEPLEKVAPTEPYLKLGFKKNSLFIPGNLRIPASELTRYQRASTVQAAIAQAGNQTSNKRENQLHTLIERIVRENPSITAKEAWQLIERDCKADEPLFDHDPILLMVDSLCIEWESRQNHKSSLKYSSFVSQLTKTKKRVATK
ncbi:MAG: hypothetical protein AB9Q21_12710 [Candidatus Reddybacter sp.]